MRVAFYTLGCKLNQCESEALASAFGSQGFFIVPASQEADLYIVNTCTVTSKSEQKARRMIRKFAKENPESRVIVTGCYAQMDPEAFESINERVRVVSGDEKAKLLDLPLYLNPGSCGGIDQGLQDLKSRKAGTEHGDDGQERFRFDAEEFSTHSRAFLKIQDGCDNRCTYCRVTLARGDAVSLSADEAVRRARALEERGYSEIILTGINLSLYRHGDTNLSGLLELLLAGTEEVRFRLSSIEPDYITPQTAAIMADPRICPHFHLPIQSGDDRILKRMARRYGADQVRKAIGILREIKDDPFIAADIIVGFPGEDQHAFENTASLLEETDIAALHVFPYSPRPGTAAAEFANPIPERIAGERTALLRKWSADQSSAYYRRWADREESILIEEAPLGEKPGRGISGNYLQLTVPEHADIQLQRGRRYSMRIQIRNREAYGLSLVE